jgi:hypothetical protein
MATVAAAKAMTQAGVVEMVVVVVVGEVVAGEAAMATVAVAMAMAHWVEVLEVGLAASVVRVA